MPFKKGVHNPAAFKKGTSGNPGGRPKGRSEFTLLAQEHAPEALKRLCHWMRSDQENSSIRASQIIIERAWGAPPSSDEAAFVVSGGGGADKIEVTFVRPKSREAGE